MDKIELNDSVTLRVPDFQVRGTVIKIADDMDGDKLFFVRWNTGALSTFGISGGWYKPADLIVLTKAVPKSESLECQLFDWEDWRQDVNGTVLIFHNVVLKVPVAEFEAGHRFDQAVLYTEISRIEFIENIESESKVEHRFELNISVGKRIVWE